MNSNSSSHLNGHQKQPGQIAIKTIALTNRFPNGLVSNDNNNFAVEYGKIHVIFGENGAGKSTFVKMLCGEIKPTSGQIWIKNQQVSSLHNPRLAMHLGIGIVRQHFNLIDDFSVFENVVLGYELVSPSRRQKNATAFSQAKNDLLFAKETELNNLRQEVIRIEDTYAVRLERLKMLPLNKDQGETETTRLEQIKELLQQKTLFLKKYDPKLVEKKYLNLMNALYDKFNNQNLTNFYRNSAARKELQKLITDFNLQINLNDKVKDISIVKQQQTEILKTLFRRSDIIIFDEPTSVLPSDQIKKFLDSLIQYKKQNKAIIFISHKINEIRHVADEITVLRQGKMVGNYQVDEITDEELVRLMVGGTPKIKTMEGSDQINSKPLLLEAKNITLESYEGQNLQHLNFKLYQGEIVGLAGIENNGQSTLLRSLYGLEKLQQGSFHFHCHQQNDQAASSIRLDKLSIHHRQKLKIGYLSQDRIKETALLNQPLHINLVFNDLTNKRFFPYKMFNQNLAAQHVYDLIKKYQIAGFHSYKQPIRSLSGGNIQKFLIGREMEKQPHLLLIDEPTWGIDLKAKNFLYNLFLEVKTQQKMTLLFSSVDLKEIVTISDRVIVMSKGCIMGVVQIKDKTAALHEIGTLITGKGS